MTKKDMEKNIDDMTMIQIKEYIESLKNHIYHLTDVMSILLSTFNTVKEDMNDFNMINKKEIKNFPISNNEKNENNITNEEIIEKENQEEKDHYNHYDQYYVIEAVFKYKNEIDGVILSSDGSGFLRSETPSSIYKDILSGVEFHPDVMFVNPSVDYMNELWNNFNTTVNKNYELISISRSEI